MPAFKYFAYGSNMLTSSLVARCNSARAIRAAYIDGHQLSFSKQSIDGSGKGHLVAEPGRRAWGVVFEIDSSQKAALDEFEGTGYSCRNDFPVVLNEDANAVPVTVYLAREVVPNLLPYEWYLALILAGADENGLTATARDFLVGQQWNVDQDQSRATRQQAYDLLMAAGILDPVRFIRERLHPPK